MSVGETEPNKEEAAFAFAVGIDGPPQPREDLRNSLGLVEYDEFVAGGDLVEAQVDLQACLLLLEVEIGPPQGPGQGCLPTLPGTQDGHCRHALKARSPANLEIIGAN